MENITRRGLIGGAAVVGGTAASGVAAEAAAAKRGKRLEVDVHITAFDTVRSPASGKQIPTGPYFASGDIYKGGALKSDGSVPAGAKKIGSYLCHGWIYNADTAANLATQTLILKGKGEIDLVGREPGPAAIAGGTGKYRNSRGQAKVEELGEEGMRVTLHVIG